MHRIVLDDYRIEALARRPDVTKAFPFFLVRVTGKRTCCTQRRVDHVDYDHVKRSVAGLTEDARRKLKEILKAESVLVYPPAGPGRAAGPVRF